MNFTLVAKPKHTNKYVKSIFLCDLRRRKPEEQHRGAMMGEERKELRTWMRRKQHDRLVEYHKQREEKRERERIPFTPPNPLVRLGLSSLCSVY